MSLLSLDKWMMLLFLMLSQAIQHRWICGWNFILRLYL
jgi:hypothetical protein